MGHDWGVYIFVFIMAAIVMARLDRLGRQLEAVSVAIRADVALTAPTTKTASAAERKPAYTSSGGCKTDVNGDMKCSHSSELNLFGSTGRSASEMKCGQNLVTLAYECKSESSAY
jgi:hypothetical protein